jgi:hypothetical protein
LRVNGLSQKNIASIFRVEEEADEGAWMKGGGKQRALLAT